MEKLDNQWWKAAKGKKHETVFKVLNFLSSNQAYVAQNNLTHMRLYGNLDLIGITSDVYSRATRKDRLTLNVVQSAIDTATNKIAKNRPRPMFLTDEGDYTAQLKAKKLQKFIDGAFYSTGIYKSGVDIFRDAAVFGNGFLKVFEKDDKIAIERVFPDEIKVDEAEGIYGKPIQMHQTKTVAREIVLQMFPDFRYEIERAPRAKSPYSGSTNIADQIAVVESWHLPSSKDAKDGNHLITIDGADLLDEEYKKDDYPFVMFKWNNRLLGFYGQGVAEQLMGIQIELNKLLRTAQISLHLSGVPKVFLENGSKVAIQQMNNEIGGIISYTGQKPIYEAINPVPQQIFDQIVFLYQRAFEIVGISQLSAQATKPKGLDSGKALREFSDIETERFATVQQAWEELFLQASRKYISVAKDIFERTGKYEVKVAGKNGLSFVDWKEIKLDEEEYEMQIFPTSMLSKTPSGRLQDVQELTQAGYIGKEVAVKLLDFPDIDAVTSRITAPYDLVEQAIERMLIDGEYDPPEPYQPLEQLISQTQRAYLRARVQNVPEDRLELLRRYMDQARAMIEASQPPPQAPAPQLQPLGAPEAPPVSDLIPLDTAMQQ